MRFRGLINVDFTGQVTNEYTKLKLALVHAGWQHVETSAFVIETADLPEIWRGIEVVAKQASAAGKLSSLTFHIQAAADFGTSLTISSTLNPTNALQDILNKPFP